MNIKCLTLGHLWGKWYMKGSHYDCEGTWQERTCARCLKVEQR